MCASGRDRSRQNQCHFTPAWVRARNGAPASEIFRRRRPRTALRRAAERLHVAQPAVREQVRKLEQELGVKRFDRNQRSVELTVAGVVLLEEARHVLRHAEVAQQAFRNAMVAMCHSAGLSPMFVEMRNPAWSACYSRWPPVPGSPCYRKRSPSASLPRDPLRCARSKRGRVPHRGTYPSRCGQPRDARLPERARPNRRRPRCPQPASGRRAGRMTWVTRSPPRRRPAPTRRCRHRSAGSTWHDARLMAGATNSTVCSLEPGCDRRRC
jgi:hypothetical protein